MSLKRKAYQQEFCKRKTIKQKAGFLVVVILTTLTSFQANAEQAYTGLDVNFISMDVANASFAPVTVRGRIGLTILPDMYPTISLESHLGFDMSDDTQRVQGSPVTLELDTYVGIYVRGDFPFGEKAGAYISLGMASAQLSGPFGNSGNGLPNDDTESGLSYNLGATYVLPWWGLTSFVEASQIVNGTHFSIGGFGVGIIAKIK